MNLDEVRQALTTTAKVFGMTPEDVAGVLARSGADDKRLDTVLELLGSIDRGIKHLVAVNARRSGRRAGVKEELRRAVIQRDGLRCRYCGKRVTRDTLVLDHVRPVALGGRTEMLNLAVACIRCNKKKGQYTLEEIGMDLLPIGEGGRK